MRADHGIKFARDWSLSAKWSAGTLTGIRCYHLILTLVSLHWMVRSRPNQSTMLPLLIWPFRWHSFPYPEYKVQNSMVQKLVDARGQLLEANCLHDPLPFSILICWLNAHFRFSCQVYARDRRLPLPATGTGPRSTYSGLLGIYGWKKLTLLHVIICWVHVLTYFYRPIGTRCPMDICKCGKM